MDKKWTFKIDRVNIVGPDKVTPGTRSELPILMRPYLVRKVKSGDKTMTCRPVKPAIKKGLLAAYFISRRLKLTRYGTVGDLLWVRESVTKYHGRVVHRSTYDALPDWRRRRMGKLRWTPSIHMRKKDARTWLLLEEVGVMELSDITVAEIKREGIPQSFIASVFMSLWDIEQRWKADFAKTWDKIYRYPFRWEDQPMVHTLKFRMVRGLELKALRRDVKRKGDRLARKNR